MRAAVHRLARASPLLSCSESIRTAQLLGFFQQRLSVGLPSGNFHATTPSRRYSQLAHREDANAGHPGQENDISGRTLSPAFVKARLESILNPPSSSTSPAIPVDAKELLTAVTPILGTSNEDLLDPFLRQISSTIGEHYTIHHPLDDQESTDVLKVLEHCWLRSLQLVPRSDRSTGNTRILPLYRHFAEFITSIALIQPYRQGRLEQTLTFVQRTMETAAKHTSGKLPTQIVTGWVILRLRTGTKDRCNLQIQLPPLTHILQSLEKILPPSENIDAYSEAIAVIYRDVNINFVPSTPGQLESRIESLRANGGVDEMINLWQGFRDQPTHKEETLTSTSWKNLHQPIYIDEVYGIFLYAFKADCPAFSDPKVKKRLEASAAEIMASIPRPIPLAVHRKLLYLRAKIDDTPLVVGAEIRSLDEKHEMMAGTARDVALTKLRDAWKAACSDGIAKDVRLYMTYIEGLGRLGEIEELQRIWNEMVSDKQCRELYYETDAKDNPNASFPPTRALNHLIASCLVIPGRGPIVALELFRQASLPTSSIPINLITINTILRHYALKGDVPAMSSLFTLAQSHKLKPDVITYTTLVQGLLRANELEMAKKALATMHRQGIAPNERMYSLLIADLARHGTRDGLVNAEVMMKEMRRRGLTVGGVTWTGLISGYFKGGWEEDGWEAVRRMSESGKRLNRVGYNMVLRQALLSTSTSRTSGIFPGGREESTLALKILARMIKDGAIPTSDTYSIVLAPMVRGKRWEEAAEVLRIMEKQRFRPETGALKNLVKACLAGMPRDIPRPAVGI